MENKYANQFDGLRFFAVFSVMIAHWLQWQWSNKLLVNIPFTHGVILFFVLSGFLISRILFQNKEKYETNNKNKGQLLGIFYLRRSLRIFPIYYLTLGFLLAINFGDIRTLFPWLISYTTNIYQSIKNTDLGEFNHFWSLAVEEQFYLFWPVLLLFNKRNALALIVVTIILSLITKTYIYVTFDNWRANSYFTLACMHSLGLGALLAYLNVYRKKIANLIRNPLWLYMSIGLYVCLMSLQVIFKWEWFKQILDEFIFAIMCAFVINKVSGDGFSGFAKMLLENRFVNYAGRISYGLYIYHLFVPALVLWLVPEVTTFNHEFMFSKYLLFILYFTITFLIAHVSYHFIEKPINTLKNKIPYY